MKRTGVKCTLAVTIILTLALSLAACGQKAKDPADNKAETAESAAISPEQAAPEDSAAAAEDTVASAEVSETEENFAPEETQAAAPEEAAAETPEAPVPAEPAELAGTPWITSIASGNIPAQAPEAKDDLYLPVSAYDMAGKNNVFVYPQFLFVDNLDGAQYLQPTDDPMVQAANQQTLQERLIMVVADLGLLGYSQEEVREPINALFDLESSYGKDAGYTARYQNEEFGAVGASMENLSLDELAALCPNYPVKETVEKFGKDTSPFYSVQKKTWLESFNAVWTEENFATLKLMTMAKIIHECGPYLDPQIYEEPYSLLGQPPRDARTNAITVCNQPGTFTQLVSNIYVNHNYSDQDLSRLNNNAAELVAAFKELIQNTSWISDPSKEKMLLKLDKMRMNILIPDGGYLHYDDLSLTPSEEGGSLLGNYLKLKAYLNEKINSRIGEDALSRFAWEYFAPSIVNCFYDPDTNSINILPGYTASGTYHNDMTEEELAGSIGWTIGHEICHGFDFNGAQIDAYGTGNSIIDESDLASYLEIADRIAAYYSTIEPIPGVFVDGNNKKAEAGADLTGMQILLYSVKDKEGFDYKEFFRSAAANYCQVLPSLETVQTFLFADTHPLNYIRGNLNAQMFQEFYDAFDVQEGDGMYLPEEKRIQFYGE